MNINKKVVFFSGGRGLKNILPKFLDKNYEISVIVNSFDDGLSTGEIREIFNMPGPSDLRKVQSLLIQDKILKKLFDYRINIEDKIKVYLQFKKFVNGESNSLFKIKLYDKKTLNFLRKYLKIFFKKIYKKNILNINLYNYSLLNCLYAGIFINTENFLKTVRIINKNFKIKHKVIPSCNGNYYLSALRENGEILISEAQIVEQRSNCKIKKLFITKKNVHKYENFSKLSKKNKIKVMTKNNIQPQINSEAKKIISDADILIYSPGTQYSSLYPTYLHRGLSKAIYNNKNSLKLFITNIGADYETPNFKASEYIINAFTFLNYKNKYMINNFFDYNFVNRSKNYKKNYVKVDYVNLKKINVKNIIKNFEDNYYSGYHSGQTILNEINEIQKK